MHRCDAVMSCAFWTHDGAHRCWSATHECHCIILQVEFIITWLFFPCEDPVLIVRRQEALEASRRRLQEELDAKAVEFKEKQKRVNGHQKMSRREQPLLFYCVKLCCFIWKQVEEEKRKQKIEIWDSMQEGKSYKAKVSSQVTVTRWLGLFVIIWKVTLSPHRLSACVSVGRRGG